MPAPSVPKDLQAHVRLLNRIMRARPGVTLENAVDEAVRTAAPTKVAEAAEIVQAQMEWVSNDPKIPIIRGGTFNAWYPGPDPAVDRCWPSLSAELAARIDPEALKDVDESSSKVVANLENPARVGSCHGLVLGFVQSGKTTNFTAVIAKAADAGYRFFIVLSGIHNALRQQTQDRLNEQLFEPNPDRWNRLTDESRLPAHRYNVDSVLASDTTAVLAVVKKNPARLRALKRWLTRAEPRILARCPILIIDDEADQATVNTARPDQHAKTINRLIRDLVESRRTRLPTSATPPHRSRTSSSTRPTTTTSTRGTSSSTCPGRGRTWDRRQSSAGNPWTTTERPRRRPRHDPHGPRPTRSGSCDRRAAADRSRLHRQVTASPRRSAALLPDEHRRPAGPREAATRTPPRSSTPPSTSTVPRSTADAVRQPPHRSRRPARRRRRRTLRGTAEQWAERVRSVCLLQLRAGPGPLGRDSRPCLPGSPTGSTSSPTTPEHRNGSASTKPTPGSSSRSAVTPCRAGLTLEGLAVSYFVRTRLRLRHPAADGPLVRLPRRLRRPDPDLDDRRDARSGSATSPQSRRRSATTSPRYETQTARPLELGVRIRTHPALAITAASKMRHAGAGEDVLLGPTAADHPLPTTRTATGWPATWPPAATVLDGATDPSGPPGRAPGGGPDLPRGRPRPRPRLRRQLPVPRERRRPQLEARSRDYINDCLDHGEL